MTPNLVKYNEINLPVEIETILVVDGNVVVVVVVVAAVVVDVVGATVVVGNIISKAKHNECNNYCVPTNVIHICVVYGRKDDSIFSEIII